MRNTGSRRSSDVARRSSPWLVCLFGVALTATGCSPSVPPDREYQLKGQILEVRPGERLVTIRHDDIRGFMPAMTMPFKVKDERLLGGRTRGDLVTGTLVVTDTDAYLTRLDVVGHAAVVETAAPPPPPVELLEPGGLVPDVRLVAADGRPLQFSSLRGSAVAVTFIYTRCPLPQFCPLMDRRFAALAARVRADAAVRRTVQLLSISFDPEYDTPAVLAAHARSVGADGVTWKFVTADRPSIDAFAPRFGVVIERDDPDIITHNLRTAVIDRQGRLARVFRGSDWTVDEVMNELVRASR